MQTTQPLTACAGLILCGGKSTRMGVAKADLPFGPEQMLQRVARLLGDAVAKVIVVAAQGQLLPTLPPEVDVVRDQHPGRGPLGGLWAGLNHVVQLNAVNESNAIDAVYATSCDSPFLHPAFVQYVLAAKKDHDIAMPVDGKFLQPLAAAYRPAVVSHVEALIAADRLRPVFLLENARVVKLPVEELRIALKEKDPELLTLLNMNDPQAYRDALAAAGFPLDPVIAAQLGLS